MILEIAIIAWLYLLYRFSVINVYAIVAVMVFSYWLPKFPVITTLESIAPTVLTRAYHPGRIALTFDDVPYPGRWGNSTEQLLHILDKYDMKATLFIVSSYVPGHQYHLIKAIKNGHQLANHGSTNSMHLLKNDTELTSEIANCDAAIKRLYAMAGVKLPSRMYYRPGCGLFSSRMLNLIESGISYKGPVSDIVSQKYILALGSVYANDPMILIPWVNYMYVRYHIEDGDVVILHDRSWTIPMLELLLPYLKSRGMSSVTLNDI